jgi:Uma2 family endonuclease
MRAVWIGVPESFLEERRRLGHDKRDELWEGVLHMVPPPSSAHIVVNSDLLVALAPIAKRRRMRALACEPGVFGTDTNYRIPDLVIVRPDQISKRGFEGAELVVEVLSPDDESRDKFPFYAKVGVCEIWLIEPETRATEIYELVTGAYRPVAFANGVARSPVLGIELRVINETLELRDGADVAVV